MVFTGTQGPTTNYSDGLPTYLFDIIIPVDFAGQVLTSVSFPVNDSNGSLVTVSGDINLLLNGTPISSISVSNVLSFDFTSLNVLIVGNEKLTLQPLGPTGIVSLSGDGHQFYLAVPPANNFTTDSSLVYADLTFSSPPSLTPCLTDSCNLLTPSGYKNVSQLKKDDEIITSTGETKKIKQIFTSTSSQKSYLIKKDTFGKNLPLVDTIISANHAFYIKNKWFLPKHHEKLIELSPEKTIFYHIKLDNYFEDNLMVNGLVMESWDGFLGNQARNYQWIKQRNNSVKRIIL